MASSELTLLPAYVGLSRNPLTKGEPLTVARAGATVNQLYAEFCADTDYPLVCLLNGRPLSRLTELERQHVVAIEEAGNEATEQLRAYALVAAGWEYRVQPGDVVHFYMPHAGKAAQLIIGLAIAAVSWYIGYEPGVQIGLSIALGGALQLLLAPRQATNNQQAGEGVFSSSLAGNAARLDDPIWKVLGRVKITPPFACSPYTENLPSNPAEPTVDCDQYYYTLFALSEGENELENAFIGKTLISHFQDIQRQAYLPPGTAPSVVQPNVVTSDEVSAGLILDAGIYRGWYAACRPGDTVTDIGIDIDAPQGLGKSDGSTVSPAWRVEMRQIDDFGTPLADPITLGSESRTANTNTEQRWSSKYHLAAPIRCEVRVARTNNPDTSAGTRDSITWNGMRGYLAAPAPLNPNVGHYEIVMRSSEQLSSLSQRDFSVILRGHCQALDASLTRQTAAFTRNPAWWLLDLWTNPIWGQGLDDSRIDLQGIYDWAQTCDARQDRLDYCVSQATDAWSLAQLIARTGRARCFRRNGIYTVARDELVDLPDGAITPRIAQPKSMTMTVTLPTLEQANGYVVQYLSNITWDTAQVECPCPGFTVTDTTSPRYDSSLPMMSNPTYMMLDGVTGATQALREGIYQAYSMALRTSVVAAKVEMEGVILSYLDAVRWLPQIKGYGSAGDVVGWNASTLMLSLSEPADLSAGDAYVTLIRDDGSLTDPVPVTAGTTAHDVILPAAPDFTLVLDDGTRDRPKYLLGPLDSGDELAKISAVKDGGKTQDGSQLYDIQALVDDPRVHLADNAYLPGPGDLQDPISTGINDSDVAYSVVVNIDALRNRQFSHGVTITGINPDWTLSLALQDGPYIAWSEWASDTDPFVTHAGNAWGNSFQATSDLGVGSESFGAMSIAATAELARAAFSGGTLTGSTSWTFWFNSDDINDNRGGLSIVVTKD